MTQATTHPFFPHRQRVRYLHFRCRLSDYHQHLLVPGENVSNTPHKDNSRQETRDNLGRNPQERAIATLAASNNSAPWIDHRPGSSAEQTWHSCPRTPHQQHRHLQHGRRRRRRRRHHCLPTVPARCFGAAGIRGRSRPCGQAQTLTPPCRLGADAVVRRGRARTRGHWGCEERHLGVHWAFVSVSERTMSVSREPVDARLKSASSLGTIKRAGRGETTYLKRAAQDGRHRRLSPAATIRPHSSTSCTCAANYCSPRAPTAIIEPRHARLPSTL